MGFFNRFLLFLYTLAVALAALGVVALCLPIFPVPEILRTAEFLLSRWETIAGAVVVFFLSVHLLACSFSGGSKHEEKKEQEPEAVVVHGAGGEVRVAVSAVSSLAEKSAAKVHGVENANAKVESRRAAGGQSQAPASSVVIGIDLELGAGQNVAQVSDAVRAAVSEQMNEVLGLSDYSIDISIAEIAGREAAKKSRVS